MDRHARPSGAERSTTSPSLTEYPAVLWPPDRQVSGQPVRRAVASAARTSAGDWHFAIAIGKGWNVGPASCRAAS